MKSLLNRSSVRGFSAMELVVVMGIMTAMVGWSVFQFTPLNENVSIYSALRYLVLDLRRVQNMAITVSQTIVMGLPTPIQRVAIRINRGSGQYIAFADIDLDNQYIAANDRLITLQGDTGATVNRVLPNKVIVNAILVDLVPVAVIDIMYLSPTAEIGFFDGAGVAINPNRVDIVLRTAQGNQTRIITLRPTGQISTGF